MIDLIFFNLGVYIKGISWIEMQGNKLHPRCFTCSQCNVSLGNQTYYDHEGMPYCSDCDTQLFCPKCAYCDEVINRGTETETVTYLVYFSSVFQYDHLVVDIS